jgi:hypothetical protein
MAVEGKNVKRMEKRTVEGTLFGDDTPKQKKRVSYDGTGRDTSGVLQREEQRDMRRPERERKQLITGAKKALQKSREREEQAKKEQYEREFKAYQKYQQQQSKQQGSQKNSVKNSGKSGSKKKQKVRV